MPTLAEVISSFLNANPHWTSHTRQRIEAHLRILIALVGNKDITRYTKADFRLMRERLPYVPSNARKRGESIVGGRPPYLSPQSIKDCMQWTKALWRYAELSFDEVTYNPTVALVPFRTTRQAVRDVIPDAALADWIVAQDSSGSLLIRTLALTGARLGEVAMLVPDDVDVDARALRIRPNALRMRLKNVNSERTVPIHSSIDARHLRALVPLVRSSDAGMRLLSKRLNYSLNKVIDNRSVCVHSLRHWTATKLKETGCEDSLVADILGHKLGTMTSRYSKRSDLERMRVAIEKISLPLGDAP